MTDYGRGGVLGAATALPATSAMSLVLANNAHPAIVAGLLVINTAGLLVLVGLISRFLINRKRQKQLI